MIKKVKSNLNEYSYTFTDRNSKKKVTLNNEQDSVVNRVCSSFGKRETFLLYGVSISKASIP